MYGNKEIYNDLTQLLHQAWVRVEWKKMNTSWKRRPSDIFQHRLKKAAGRGSIGEFIDKLCKGLSLQSINVPTELIFRLESAEKNVMAILRRNTVKLTLLAKEGLESGEPLT